MILTDDRLPGRPRMPTPTSWPALQQRFKSDIPAGWGAGLSGTVIYLYLSGLPWPLLMTPPTEAHWGVPVMAAFDPPPQRPLPVPPSLRPSWRADTLHVYPGPISPADAPLPRHPEPTRWTLQSWIISELATHNAMGMSGSLIVLNLAAPPTLYFGAGDAYYLGVLPPPVAVDGPVPPGPLVPAGYTLERWESGASQPVSLNALPDDPWLRRSFPPKWQWPWPWPGFSTQDMPTHTAAGWGGGMLYFLLPPEASQRPSFGEGFFTPVVAGIIVTDIPLARPSGGRPAAARRWWDDVFVPPALVPLTVSDEGQRVRPLLQALVPPALWGLRRGLGDVLGQPLAGMLTDAVFVPPSFWPRFVVPLLTPPSPFIIPIQRLVEPPVWWPQVFGVQPLSPRRRYEDAFVPTPPAVLRVTDDPRLAPVLPRSVAFPIWYPDVIPGITPPGFVVADDWRPARTKPQSLIWTRLETWQDLWPVVIGSRAANLPHTVVLQIGPFTVLIPMTAFTATIPGVSYRAGGLAWPSR